MDMGVGQAGLVKLCRFLDMKPLTHTSFTQHAHVVCDANKFVVTRMFDNAADVVRRVYRDTDPSIGEDDTIDLTISFDGAILATFDHAISTNEKPQHDARWKLTAGASTRRCSPPCRSQDHVGRMWARHYRPTSQNTSGTCTPDWHTFTCWNSASSGKRRTIMKVCTRGVRIQRWLRNDDEESVMCPPAGREDRPTAAEELEEDFQASCITRGDYEQDYDTTDLCPVCDTTELTGENVNVCSNCEAFVCPNCGAYDSNLTTKLQEWVCLLCQKQRQTQQELRDTGPPQQQEPEDHTTGQVDVEKSGANILDVGQPDLHKQDTPYSRRNDQHNSDTGYAEQPGVEPPHIRSGGQANVHQMYTRGIAEPNPQSTDNDYAKQQDLHTSDTRYEVSDTPYEVSDIRYEAETEKHGRDAYLEAQREQIKSDTHYESNERTNSRDFYSGNSGHPDEAMTAVRYTRHTEGNGEAAASLHAICRTTSLQDGLVDAADSTSACAAIRRSFDAPCVTNYHELSDSSDDVAGSDYERMHRSVTDYEAQGDTFRSCGQSSGRRVLTEADLDTANSELSYVDAYSHNWIHRDDDTVNTDVGDAEFADDSIDIGRGKTARPRQLVLGQQSTERPPSASQRRDGSGGVTQKQDGAAEKTGGEPVGNLVEKTTEVHQQMASVASRIADVRDGQRWSSTQPLGQPAKTTPRHELVDGQSSPAEVTDRQEGLRKKKPSALEKVSVNEAESDKRVSPSRRSPRSPPRSPSWMRYRDGSSRSSPNRTLSPPISPTARYQSSLPDSTHGSCDDSYDGDYFTYAGNYMHDQQGKIQSLADDALSYNDRAQPKPARSFSDQRSLSDDAIEMESLDLATFAAAVASDTAHLTNLSVSPTQQDVIDTARDDVLSMTAIGSGDVDVLPEPKPKSIDHHGNKRQKTKPPPTDWSPVTDLSPIIDVSPSIEAIEQAEMWAQQDPRTRAKDTTLSAQDATDSDSRYMTQSLKRYQHFDDISKIGNGVLQSNDEAGVAGDSGVDHAAVGDIMSARDISNERRIGRVLVESQMQPPVVVVPPVTLIHTSCHTPQTTPVTLTQPSYQTPQTTPVTLTQSIRRIPDATPVTITEIAHKTPDTTPVTLTQTTPHRIPDTTPVTLTQSTPHRIPDATHITMTQTTQHRIPYTTPITLTQTARRTPETTPVAMAQPKPHQIPDTTTVTLTQTVRRTPDTTTVTIAQSTPHQIPDTTPVTITHTTPHRIPDTTSVTTTQSAPHQIPDMTPVTITQSTPHRIPDTTPVTVTQTTHRTPNDVTHIVRQIPDIPQTVPHSVPLRQEERRVDENKVHLAEGLNKDSRPVNESDKSAMSNPPLHPLPDDQAHAANRRAEDRKIRRKLPPLPPDGETTTTPERPGPQTSEKELLRQRLRQRQAENRRPQKQPHTNVEEKSKPDVTSRIRTTPTVDKPQARKQSAPIATPSVTTRTPGTSKQASAPVLASRTQLPPVHHPAPTPLVAPTAAGVGRVYKNGERPTANVALSSGNATRPSSIVDRPSTSVIRPRARTQPCQEESTTVHGIRVPVDVKFLKQRLKEEIQIVTASRRLRIDEQDGLRRMEVK
ncbi:hypothetical protein LSAT2_016632 [Lamellibrachia satsuma]|nr:hypothetical protein LSAT2_016632 [Lamellibrachia satsuma]